MLKIILLVLFIIIFGTATYFYIIKHPHKEEIFKDRISLIASIATIIGVTITMLALIYAFKQYDTYKNELLKKPNLFIKINPITRPPYPKKTFLFQSESLEYSEPVEIEVKITNNGEATTKEVYFVLSFNNYIKVDKINYVDRGFNLPIQSHQIFMYTNRYLSLPPHFPFIRIMHFTIRLHKDCLSNSQIVGRLDIQGGGEKYRSYFLHFDPKNEEFYTSKNSDISSRFDVAPLNLKQ
ncbi:MAG: hypothetical protein ACTSYZ_07070 [Candidatus Helarchaeota archaeon]